MTTRSAHLKGTTASLYQTYRKYDCLFKDHFKSEWVHPDLIELVELATKPADAEKGDAAKETKSTLLSSSSLKVEIPGVYSFLAFTPEFLQLFTEEIDNFYTISEQYNISVRRPNSMNNYGVVLNEIGLRPLLTSFQQSYLWPICRQLFPNEASQFDDHHSFLVRYQSQEDLGLDMHTDDSDVTFNVCLGEPGFTGSTLTFCGMFGASNHRHYSHTYHHEIGRAVLHLGSQRHGADDIASGRRMNLIVWSRNHKWRASDEYNDIKRFYQREEGPPDKVCLSYTHDVDYIAFKDLPQRALNLKLSPWCPPPEKEYEGFEEQMQSSLEKKSSSGRKQDEL